MNRLQTLAGIVVPATITVIFAYTAPLDPVPYPTPELTATPSNAPLIVMVLPPEPIHTASAPTPSQTPAQERDGEEASMKTTGNGITEGDVIIGELTYYDVCVKCCGKTDGITASGLKIRNGVEPEVPVASCNWLPLGSAVEIGDVLYIVADRGGKNLDKIGRLDIFTPEGHAAALELGRKKDVAIRVVSLP